MLSWLEAEPGQAPGLLTPRLRLDQQLTALLWPMKYPGSVFPKAAAPAWVEMTRRTQY